MSLMASLATPGTMAGNDRRPFGDQVHRTEAMAAQLADALQRIDYRISGRCSPQDAETATAGAPKGVPSLEVAATNVVVALEWCLELAQRIQGDVGAIG
jgi:hypothetical protein